MTYWGESATAWSAFAAVGALALAFPTVARIVVAVRRRRDDRRGDDQLRHEDRLDLDLEARLRCDQIEREDDDAGQVLVETRLTQDLSPAYAAQQVWEVRISAPVAYSIDRLTVKLASVQPGAGVVVRDVDHHQIVRPRVRVNGDQALWVYRTAIPEDFCVAISFLNERNTLYFSYLGRTMRFPAGSDVLAAVQEIYNDISGSQSYSELPGS